MRDIFFKGLTVLKQVLKLSIKCILVCLPFIAFPFYCQHFMLDFLGHDYVGPYWNKNFTNTKQERYYSTIILGDSTANAAYLPEVLSDSSVNLALAGSSTIEGYYTLYDYLKHNEAPEDVFISYMDYHLEEDDFTWDVSNYIHKFSPVQNQQIKQMIKKYSDNSLEELTAENYDFEVTLYSIYSPTIYANSVLNGIVEDRKDENKNFYDETKTRLGRYCSITNTEYEPETVMGYSTFKVGLLQHMYCKKILDLCEKKDINVHLVKLPLSTDAGFIDNYEAEVQYYYDSLLEDYDNVDFYWFHTTYEHEFFCDQYHMNNHGSFRFSRELKEQYPEVFADDNPAEASMVRMEAFDADISGENYMGELTKWIADKPYTLVMLDNTGNLGEIYYMYVGYHDHYPSWLETGDKNSKYPYWYVSGDESGMPDGVEININANGAIISYGGIEAELVATDSPGITVAVLDNVNKRIVCTRQCLFTERGFRELY